MRPHRFPRMCGTTSPDEADKVQGDTSNACRQSSSVRSANVPHRRAAGIVDQDIDAAEALERSRDDVPDAVSGYEICLHREHFGAGLAPDFLPPAPGPRRARADRDPGTLAGQRERRRLARDPARCGDQRNLALQAEIHPFLRPLVWPRADATARGRQSQALIGAVNPGADNINVADVAGGGGRSARSSAPPSERQRAMPVLVSTALCCPGTSPGSHRRAGPHALAQLWVYWMAEIGWVDHGLWRLRRGSLWPVRPHLDWLTTCSVPESSATSVRRGVPHPDRSRFSLAHLRVPQYVSPAALCCA